MENSTNKKQRVSINEYIGIYFTFEELSNKMLEFKKKYFEYSNFAIESQAQHDYDDSIDHGVYFRCDRLETDAEYNERLDVDAKRNAERIEFLKKEIIRLGKLGDE